MKRILIICFSNLKHDARVMRQVKFLAKRFALTICSYDIEPNPAYTFVKLPNARLTLFKKGLSAVLLLLKRYTLAQRVLYPYRDFLSKQLATTDFDLIIANDIETVPLAFDLKKANTKIIFDAHEYAPRHFEDKLWWRIFFQGFNTFMCKKFIPRVNGMITIGQILADEYEKNFGVKPLVMTNACPFHDLQPLASDEQTIKLVHHGIVNRSRKIELIIEMVNLLPPNFTLDLILVIPPHASQQTKEYFKWLKEFSKTNARVRFRDAVPINEIVPLLHHFDMGIILAPPINFNYSNGLPNKLFDYIQARIGVISWPTPEIAKTVKDYNLGVISETFTIQALADKIRLVGRREVQEFKNHSMVAAKELNAEKNEVLLNELVDRCLGVAP